MSQKDSQPDNCIKDISSCRAQPLGDTSLVECHEETACTWLVFFGHLKLCEHPKASLIKWINS